MLPRLAGLERFGEKSATNLIQAIEASKSRALARFLFGLGIRHVGEEVARQLATEYGSIAALIDENWSERQLHKLAVVKENARRRKSGELLEWVPLEGIGPEITDSLSHFFAEPSNRAVLAELQSLGVSPPVQARAPQGGR